MNASHSTDSTPVRMVAISDGRAGNRRQASALADALAGHQVAHACVDAAAPWRWAAPRLLPGAGRGLGRDIEALRKAPPAVIVGCGRQAALATRQLRSRTTRAVQILDPRIHPRHWDVVVVPEHDALRGDNVVTLLGSLHPVDEAWLAAARHEWPRVLEAAPLTSVLVGGPTDAVPLQIDALTAALRTLAHEVQLRGGELRVTTSGRTPRAWLPRLREVLAVHGVTPWTSAEDGPNPYPALLAHATRIICTPDSVNMLSEACATPAIVEVMPCQATGRIARFLGQLHDLRRIRRLGSDAAIDTTPLRETARVAEDVRARLDLR